MTRVQDIMSEGVVTIAPDESAALAARLLARHNIGALPVCSPDGALRGVVTDRDILTRCVAAERSPADTAVRSIMTREVETVAPGDDVRAAAHAMALSQVRRLPVTDGRRVVGMLALGDLARSRAFDMEAGRALSGISENVRSL